MKTAQGLMCILLSVTTISVCADMYRWEDEQGRVHFSDRKPDSASSQVEPLPQVHNGYQPSAVKATPDTRDHARDLSASKAKKKRRQAAVDKARQEKEARKEKCDDLRLKSRLNNISRSTSNGVAALMKKQQAREKLWADIRRYCY